MSGKRRGPGNRYTSLSHPAAPRRLHRLSQSPAGCLSRPACPNLPGLVIPEHHRCPPGLPCLVLPHAAAAVTHAGYGTVAGMPGAWRLRGQPRRPSRPASRPWPVTSAGLVRQAAPAGPGPVSAAGPPSTTSRSASKPAAAGPCCPQAARGRGKRGRRRQRGDGAHRALNQESHRDGQLRHAVTPPGQARLSVASRGRRLALGGVTADCAGPGEDPAPSLPGRHDVTQHSPSPFFSSIWMIWPAAQHDVRPGTARPGLSAP
jgi:hypothetical protein